METKAQAAEDSIDKSLTKDEAFNNALLASELYFKALKLAVNPNDRTRLTAKFEEVLDRCDAIKVSDVWTPPKTVPPVKTLKAPISKREVTRSEQIILLEGSKLHGFIFPPWDTDPDDILFEGDENYRESKKLELSEAQRENFDGWRRGSKIFSSHTCQLHSYEVSMEAEHEIDLVQDITTDCSVVASLCAWTARALKGHSKLLSSIIYPHDKSTGKPRLSKIGKYIFRLHFNGCYRKVIIDDRLPTSKSSRSLHVIDRRNPNLLWPALIEKAYLKVRGGYDFPGSNSGTDLWVMTGWIPEQVFLQRASDELQPKLLWNRIFRAFGFGDVMITLGTGKLTNREERELGLAGEHDYAVLDMEEVGNQRRLLIKNPWCNGMVWKGSQQPTWTSDMLSSLPGTSDQTEAQSDQKREKDAPGTFWLSLSDTIQHFESLYLNWNPGLFTHRQDHHFSWTIPQHSVPGSFTKNPQFSIESSQKTTVWILLSRHFKTAEQELMRSPTTIVSQITTNETAGAGAGASTGSSPLGYISLYIYSSTSGHRVNLSDNALHRGAFVDSPQTLASLDLPANEAHTIVIASQGLPLPKYAFTLSVFSRCELDVYEATKASPYNAGVSGAWTKASAGGNAHAATYPLNPQFKLVVPSRTPITLLLETEREELAVHVKLVWGGGKRVASVTARDVVGGSGDYRRGCALADLPIIEKGVYTIVCSTFESGEVGKFTLRAGSMVICELTEIEAEGAGMLRYKPPILRFEPGCERMLAPVSLQRMVRFMVIVRSSATRRAMLRVCLERGLGPGREVLSCSNGGDFSDAVMGIRSRELHVAPDIMERGGLWIVIERLGAEGVDEVDVEVLSDGEVRCGPWGAGDT